MSTLQRARRAAGEPRTASSVLSTSRATGRAARCETRAARGIVPPCAPSAAARGPDLRRRPCAVPRRSARRRGTRTPPRGALLPRARPRNARTAASVFAALGERERCERGVVAVEQALEQRMLGIVRLNDDLTGAIGAPRAACDLQDRLREPLVAPRIRAEQPLVRVQHPDERDAREVVALRQHLRADQDLDVARLDVVRARLRARPCGSCCRDRGARCAPRETAPRARRRRAACRRRRRCARCRTCAHGQSSAVPRRSDGSGRRPPSRAPSCARRSAALLAALHCGQNSAGAKPRRFRNSNTWLPAVKVLARSRPPAASIATGGSHDGSSRRRALAARPRCRCAAAESSLRSAPAARC